jgi:uncharacterized protein with HEPN domain
LPSSEPKTRFRDIVENIDAIISYVGDMGQEQFIADRLRYDATERCLSRISEAAIKLGMLAEELAPNQPWNDIRGLGNWLRHDYPNVIKTVIWKTVSRDLKPLRRDCEAAIRELDRRSRREKRRAPKRDGGR